MEVEKALETRRQLGTSRVEILDNILVGWETVQKTPREREARWYLVQGHSASFTRGCHVLARQRINPINNNEQIELCRLRALRALSSLQHIDSGKESINMQLLCVSMLNTFSIISHFCTTSVSTLIQCSKSPAVLDETYLALFGE